MRSNDFSRRKRPSIGLRSRASRRTRLPVTNAEFPCFVKATGHVTVVERLLDAKNDPDADTALLVPDSLVFRHRRTASASTSTAPGGRTYARGGLEGAVFVCRDEFAPMGRLRASTWQGRVPLAEPWHPAAVRSPRPRWRATNPTACALPLLHVHAPSTVSTPGRNSRDLTRNVGFRCILRQGTATAGSPAPSKRFLSEAAAFDVIVAIMLGSRSCQRSSLVEWCLDCTGSSLDSVFARAWFGTLVKAVESDGPLERRAGLPRAERTDQHRPTQGTPAHRPHASRGGRADGAHRAQLTRVTLTRKRRMPWLRTRVRTPGTCRR